MAHDTYIVGTRIMGFCERFMSGRRASGLLEPAVSKSNNLLYSSSRRLFICAPYGLFPLSFSSFVFSKRPTARPLSSSASVHAWPQLRAEHLDDLSAAAPPLHQPTATIEGRSRSANIGTMPQGRARINLEPLAAVPAQTEQR